MSIQIQRVGSNCYEHFCRSRDHFPQSIMRHYFLWHKVGGVVVAMKTVENQERITPINPSQKKEIFLSGGFKETQLATTNHIPNKKNKRGRRIQK